MSLTLSAGQLIAIEGRTYKVAHHPHAPSAPYLIPGRRARVYQLSGDGEAPYALKLFAAPVDHKGLSAHAQLLSQYSHLPGLQACTRIVVDLAELAGAASDPPIASAVLMPWVGDNTWQALRQAGAPLTPAQSHDLALRLARTVAAMEQRRIVHGALDAEHLLIPATLSSVELVSLEGVRGGDIPAASPAAGARYRHPGAQASERTLEDDRFAGSLLLAEILGWCDERVVAASAGETYFDPDELQQQSSRYRTILISLGRFWGGEVARVFAAAWHSSRLHDCPSIAEWARLIEILPMPSQRLRMPASGAVAEPGSAGRPPVTLPSGVAGPTREQRARTELERGEALAREGRLAQAVDALQEAYKLAPALAAPYLTAALLRQARASERSDPSAALSAYYAAQLVAPPGELRDEVGAALAALEARLASAPPLDRAPPVAPLPVALGGDQNDEQVIVQPPEDEPAAADRRLSCSLVIALAVFSLVLASVALWRGLLPDGRVAQTATAASMGLVGTSTAQATLATPIASVTTGAVAPTSTIPPLVGTAGASSPVATTPAPPTPTAEAQQAVVRLVRPEQILSGDPPAALVIEGANLTQIEQVRLVADDGNALSLGLLSLPSAGQAALDIAGLTASGRGTGSYVLEINGRQSGQRVTWVVTRAVQGVNDQNNFSPRIDQADGVYFTRMRAEPRADSERVGRLVNGDQVEVLEESDAEPGWYRVRVRKSADPNQINVEGWIERWLVTNLEAPPRPTSAPAVTALPAPTRAPARLRFVLQNYNDSRECISIRITGIGTSGWYFQADGLNGIRGNFDNAGNARACGLRPEQEVTISVYNRNGIRMAGGAGVPTKGSAIMLAAWR